MPTVTKIERQKHHKERLSVFVDGEYAFSLSEDTAYEYRIEEGKDINEYPLEEIFEEDEYRNALKKGYSLVSHGAKTEKQLRDKMMQSGFSEKAVDRAIERIEENGYINDMAYCEDFLRNTLLGKRGIEYKLRQRGISGENISLVLENIDFGFYIDNARKVLIKNRRKFENLTGYSKKNKIYAILEQNGYGSDVIEEIMPEFYTDDFE